MAIDVLKRQGKSAVTGVLGKNLRRVAGNIGSVIRGDVGIGDSSETAPINRTKQSTKMLSFPLDVGADPGIGNHGHYIMFFINEQQNAKLKFGGGYAAEANAQDMGLENIVGETRKRKLKGLTKNFDTKERLGGTLSSILFSFSQGIKIFRVHNVEEVKQGILVFETLLNR